MPPILIGDADRGKAATAGFVGGIRNEGVDAMKSQNLFPARLLGFGFYWAWLFLIGVSPSPIVGDVSFAGAPFEIWELGFSLASGAAIVAFARQLSSDGGRKVLLAACFVVGPLGTVSLLAAEGGLVIGSAALVALADAATFMLWLCFFGHMRVGETALYMALSYAAGALLCIVIMSLDARMALACAAALPVLSGLAFSLSNRFYTKETGEPSMFSHGQPGGTDGETTFPYMHRMACALGLYALLFGLMTSVAVCNGFGGGFVGPYIEAPCCLVLGVLLAATFRSQKGARRLYLAYRLIPLLFAVGFAAFLFSDDRTYFVASACVMLAYLTFEITALNDFCNAVKVRGLSLVRVLGFARLAITGGILGGWSIGYATTFLPLDPTLVAMAVGIVVVVAASTLVFTEKEMFSVQGVADERILSEEAATASRGEGGFAQSLVAFGEIWSVSKREMEVLDLLVKGRNTQYISDQLFIAQGTAKTHIYNIYRKIGIHTKMELLDAFDAFCHERGLAQKDDRGE